MKVGLIYEIESVAPHSPEHEYRAFWNAMTQIELADRLGFDSVWAVEHHFLNEFSYCSAPEIFLACVSQRTSHLRLGHGVAVLPFNHPIRVAERAALLDIMSNGRLEFGTGRSTTVNEILGFNLLPEETRPRWREAIEMIPRMWCEDSFTHRGHFWNVERPISVIPKPLQKPHPPLWVAAVSPDTFRLAGECGLGALGFTLGVEIEQIAARVALYREASTRAHPIGYASNNRVSMNLPCLTGDDPIETENFARPAVLWYARRGLELVREMAQLAARGESYRYLDKAALFDPAEITDEYYDYLKSEDLVAVGTPEEIVRVAARYREIGTDQLLFIVQYGGLPHDRVMRAIELIGERVLPELHRWATAADAPSAQP